MHEPVKPERRRLPYPVWSAPPPPRPDESIDRIRSAIRTVQELLAAPTAASLMQCEAALHSMAYNLHALIKSLRGAGEAERAALAPAAAALRDELAHMQNLLDSSAVLDVGWLQILSAALAGYTRTGAPAPLACEQQIFMKG